MLFRGFYLLFWMILASSLTQCASKNESNEQSAEVETPSDENQVAEEESAENEVTSENGANSENSADTEISAGEDESASIANTEIPQEDVASENPGSENTGLVSDSVPASETATDSVPATTPSYSGDTGASSGMQVFYVKKGGANLKSSPQEGASSVGSLDQGDHLLVTVEGNWAKTSTGSYVNINQLSAKSVGRKLASNDWK